MKRTVVFALLLCMVLGQSLWLASPELALAQDDPQIADEGATQTAESVSAAQTSEAVAAAQTAESDAATGTANAAAIETASAAQVTQDAADAEASAAAAMQTQASADATGTAFAAAEDEEVQGPDEPTASSTPTYKNILPGDWIRVSVSTLNVRSEPSTSVGTVALVRANEEFEVLDGPVVGGSYWWVRIDMGTAEVDERWLAANFV
ncbi:MAG: SH3 domain-containing protein, partial [Thermomicrobiales bacterium]